VLLDVGHDGRHPRELLTAFRRLRKQRLVGCSEIAHSHEHLVPIPLLTIHDLTFSFFCCVGLGIPSGLFPPARLPFFLSALVDMTKAPVDVIAPG
jgi:hypothetical protein